MIQYKSYKTTRMEINKRSGSSRMKDHSAILDAKTPIPEIDGKKPEAAVARIEIKKNIAST